MSSEIVARCDLCKRTYKSEKAFQQHMRDSPAHMIQRHLQDPPAHTFQCELCERGFQSMEDLQQHLREFPRHNQTPLDIFFKSFITFPYDRSTPPSEAFLSLRRHMGWRRGEEGGEEAWNRYQEALRQEIELWFGAEDDLIAWHTLCRAINIREPPLSYEDCMRAVRRTHVNIVDLIEWGRQGGDKKVRTFKSVGALKAYSKKTDKIFVNTLGEEGQESNVVLRHLLRRIFTVAKM